MPLGSSSTHLSTRILLFPFFIDAEPTKHDEEKEAAPGLGFLSGIGPRRYPSSPSHTSSSKSYPAPLTKAPFSSHISHAASQTSARALDDRLPRLVAATDRASGVCAPKYWQRRVTNALTSPSPARYLGRRYIPRNHGCPEDLLRLRSSIPLRRTPSPASFALGNRQDPMLPGKDASAEPAAPMGIQHRGSARPAQRV